LVLVPPYTRLKGLKTCYVFGVCNQSALRAPSFIAPDFFIARFLKKTV
jgi:hypothetical protein